MSTVSKFGPFVDSMPEPIRYRPDHLDYFAALDVQAIWPDAGSFHDCVIDRALHVLPNTPVSESFPYALALFTGDRDTLLRMAIEEERLDVADAYPVEPVAVKVDRPTDPKLAAAWDRFTAASAVPEVLPATVKHSPNLLGEYRTYRSGIDVVDSMGNAASFAHLRRDANVWLTGVPMSERFDRLVGEWVVFETPECWLRSAGLDARHFVADPEDMQFPYVVNPEMATTPFETEAERARVRALGAGSAVKTARVKMPLDKAGTFSTRNRVVLDIEHAVTLDDMSIIGRLDVATTFGAGTARRIILGHGHWQACPSERSTRTDVIGRPTGSYKVAEAISADQVADVAQRRIANGWTSFALTVGQGKVAVAQRSDRRYVVTMSSPGAKRKVTTARDGASVRAAIGKWADAMS